MSAFEGSMKNMLQGVSQQLQRERLEGQVTAQENMLSDVVTGLRRRPGAEVITALVMTSAVQGQLLAFDTDVGAERCKVLLNGVTGNLYVFDDSWGLISTLQHDYFKFTDRTEIQHASINDRMYILNKSAIPAVATTTGGISDNSRWGYVYIKTGAYSVTYSVTLSDADGRSFTASYTTPASTAGSASAQSTPQYIMDQLASQITASGIISGASEDGPYLVIQGLGNAFSVTTSASSSYIGVSNTSHVQQVSDLPSKLPSPANGYIIAVGSSSQPSYYAWDFATSTWKETAAVGSPATYTNMPKYLFKNSSSLYQLGDTYEARLAGDDTSNPRPHFIGYGIDGIGSFQGRLVLLSGSYVNMSASGKPYRFFRSTIESLLAADPIEVAASANSSAAYQYCVPFNKDLLLFSEKYQALVPGGGTLVTPSNATVVVTSTYEADMASSPLTLGRTCMYPAPRSTDYYGMMEMLPSEYTDSQYVSSDVTAHLPKYLAGRCRFSVASSVAGIAAFASTTDLKTLVVHEYTWDSNTKVQQAWHRWTFPYPIADAFFSGNAINLVFVQNNRVMVCEIDPRVGTLTEGGDRRPFLDCYFTATVTDAAVNANTGASVAVPAFYQDFDPLWYTTARLSDQATALMGEEVGVETRTTTALVTVPSFSSGSVTMGQSYRSSISPSMPTVKDSNGVVISSNKLTILRFMIGTENSYEYEALVQDSSDDQGDDQEDMSTLYWGSADLELGSPHISMESTAILPCRTNASTTTVVLYTDSLGELNIVSLEYVARYNQKLKRR